ncbi:MAG: AAC(3) family N-acetyltransferase [Thermoleophilia bacterium]
MRRVTADEVASALAEIGVGEGDVLHVQSDLLRIGPVDAPMTRDGLCGFHLDALRAAVGSSGTVTCCTAFEDYGRWNTTYVREDSPSRTDTLSEYIRTRPGAVRSMHPIVSVTGLGARAEELCGGPHYDGFGYESPWGRLHRADAWICSYGLGPLHGGTTFNHFVERMYGVPYQYTKMYSGTVMSGGREVPGPFTMSVRYLDFRISNVPTKVKPMLLEAGAARMARLGRGVVWACRARAYLDLTFEHLHGDRWFLLEEPPAFRPGEIPTDGPTGEMRMVYDHQEAIA